MQDHPEARPLYIAPEHRARLGIPRHHQDRVGLILAGSISLAEGALTGGPAVVIAAAVFAVLLLSRANPALLALSGALVSLFTFSAR